ncbi:MAG: hypothetical protein LBI87_05355 [Candidatus Accumulibacter sp.]|jgi:hypothetical protein|nr:hypothetical protein [Accumulibacter sp.]
MKTKGGGHIFFHIFCSKTNLPGTVSPLKAEAKSFDHGEHGGHGEGQKAKENPRHSRESGNPARRLRRGATAERGRPGRDMERGRLARFIRFFAGGTPALHFWFAALRIGDPNWISAFAGMT